MSTTTIIQDIRRTDLRTNVLENPFWISSAVFNVANAGAPDDKSVLLFSFPTAGQIVIIDEVLIQVTSAFTAGTTIDVGFSTIATDAVTAGGVVTDVDQDEYIKAADITATSTGVYGPTTGNTSDWLAAKAAGTWAAPRYLTGAATTVPVVTLECYNAGTVAAGKCIVHMLITILP